MPRIRSIKPEFWQDEKMATLDPATRLVFLGLISMADDKGRLVDSVKMIDGFIYPLTDDSSRTSLEILARLSRIVRYNGPSGQPLLQITNWARHQKVDHPNPYALPAPQGDLFPIPIEPSREALATGSRKNRDSINDLRSTSTTNDLKTPGANAPEDDKPTKASTVSKNGRLSKRETWLTPYGQAWVERFGGDPDWAVLAKVIAKARKKEPDDAVLLPAFRRFLDKSDIQYVNVHKFASGIGVWLGEAPAGPLHHPFPKWSSSMNDDDFMKLTPMEIFKRTLVKTLRFSEMLRSGVGLRAPWPAMDKIVGMPFLPGWLVLVGARAKGGKSTLLRGLFQAWTEIERRVLYVGSEQSAGVLLFLLAAEKLGIPARDALDPASKAHDVCLFEIEYVQQELANAGIAMVVAEPELSTERFLGWCKYAAVHGFDAVLLDHFHRLSAPVGDRWTQRSEDIRKIKSIAEKRELVVVAAAQLRNAEGPLGEYEVPGVNSWAETANLRRECDLAFQAWRPLKKGVTGRDRQMAREVPGYGARLVQRNTMAIRVDAHRYHEEEDRGCRLSVVNGALESYQPDGSDVLPPARWDL